MAHYRPGGMLRIERRGGAIIAASALFALGLAVGAMERPALTSHVTVPLAAAFAVANAGPSPQGAAEISPQSTRGLGYPAEVIRVIDGDTFRARVRVWPGLDIDTKVRLRGIDAAEMHARCADEFAKAQAARAALQSILAEGGVTVSEVGIDKYGGRVDATASTSKTADVSAAMLTGGWARAYDGRRRGSWCG